MASITMTASVIGNTNMSEPTSMRFRPVIVAKAMKLQADLTESANIATSNGRRDLVFAAAAAALCCIASGHGNAIAGEDPKPGTPEAKKLYAPVCVTMPTARICRK